LLRRLTGSTLRALIFFAFVMDKVMRDIQGHFPWCMFFADDVVLVDDSQEGVKIGN
jgi:hypothetical protein